VAPVKALAATAVVVLAHLSAPAGAQDAAPPACTGFAPGTVAGTVEDPEVVELSGIVASRAHRDLLWVHDDSGGSPEVVALSSTGASLGHYAVEGAAAVDWEDIGIGPGPQAGRTYLYMADIGDNGATREHVTVYMALEPEAAPDGSGGSLPLVTELTVRYPAGPSDAESLFVDPLSGDLYVITKDFGGPSRVLRAAAGAVAAGGELTLEDVGGIDVVAPTAADISPDGSTVLVRTYQSVLAFRRPAGRPLAAAFQSPPCAAPSVDEPQGEAIGFGADGASYVTVSEGAAPPLHRFDVDPPLVTTTTAVTTTPPATASTAPAATEDDGGGSSVVPIVVVVGGLALAVVVVTAAVLRARRQAPSRTR
jgi:hypothetical protein